MGLLGRLFGSKKPAKAKAENLLAILTAQVTMTSEQRLLPTGKAGVCFKQLDSAAFHNVEGELRGVLDIGRARADTAFRLVDDGFGFQWAIVADKDFEDLVTSVHMVASTLDEQGFGHQLLAAVFPFSLDDPFRTVRQQVYWVYSFRRGAFYPFVPKDGQKRDNALEMSLASKLEKEFPVEKALEAWYPLWGVPFD